ncbi:helix-turn-helix domain-containing protein [Bifidobacterium oedipodis]|uniref:Helix-turn-helix motif containing protein n=1 Tax=Bifidobacterium oedipodis TaxID=2675322 RepID=A0A7Y0EP53_9BIFI|nr:helix-turn-helix transcriptional regulator [Bifidobacterium sp. DSM 109957]NMM93884.1 helix-turn-helix motif containing protein [Bifidobacterium sp. DSM 109957]
MGLRDYRVKRGLSQEQVAKRAGISQPRLSDYEVGRKPIGNMTLDTARALCKALNVSNPLNFYREDSTESPKENKS